MNNLKSFVVLAAARETGGTAVEPPLTAVAAGGFRPSASRQAMRRRWCTLAGGARRASRASRRARRALPARSWTLGPLSQRRGKLLSHKQSTSGVDREPVAATTTRREAPRSSM